MRKKLGEKTKEALVSVLPISVIVLVLSIIFEMTPGITLMFLVGALMLIVGMGLFSMGADMAMMPMGEGVGAQVTRTKRVWLMAFITFILGFIITIAEPDLQVLADQVPSINTTILVLTVAAGVGIFLVVALFRFLFRINLSTLLIGLYIFVFVLSTFVPKEFLSVAFDSGGVTTGPITVPFIMAFGLGLASVRADREAKDDSFGLVALCSIGPILAVLLLGIIYDPQGASYTPVMVPAVETTRDVTREFVVELPHYLKEVLSALLPIVAVFALFQIISRRYKKRQLAKIAVGFVYTLLGLVLFLTGVSVGFIPVGNLVGKAVGGSPYNWVLIPLGMLIGYFIVKAEPAVHVLNKQVEEVSGGAIPGSAMNTSLSIGVAISLGIAMVRVLTGISIYWFLIPGYALALVLSFFVPKIFTGIAFDSGGVVSGPMTSTFLLPFAMGACEAARGEMFIMSDAFGIVAMVAMTPLITIQLMGFFYTLKIKRAAEAEAKALDTVDEIIEFEEDTSDV